MGLDLILWGVMCHQFVAWASHASGERLFIKLILVSGAVETPCDIHKNSTDVRSGMVVGRGIDNDLVWNLSHLASLCRRVWNLQGVRPAR